MSYFTRFQLHRIVVGYVMLLCVATTILAVNTSSTRTINVAAAGKLSTLLPEADRQYVENLTLTGKLNGTDFKILRAMATDQNLQTLDLSGASIVSGGDPYYTVSSTGSKYYTSNNEAGYCLFGSCKKLQKVVLPNSLTQIGSSVFYSCSDLRTMVIGSKVTSIGSGLFWKCTQLSSVQINNNPNFHLANGILYNKDYSFIIAAVPTYNFGNLTFRSSVKYIQASAFACCSKLTNVTIPTSVTEIMSYVFAETGISSVTFHSSITRLYSDAFEGCKNLKQVDLRQTNITSLDWGVFDNSGLVVVYLPKKMTELKQYAFAHNPLKHIFAYTDTPATMYDFNSSYASFKNVNTNTCVVHVPRGKVNTYKAAAGWKEFQYITDSQEIESVKEAYAVYTDDTTLTFYYDNLRNSRDGSTFDMNKEGEMPKWPWGRITHVVFDKTFAKARPTTTKGWFWNMSKLTEISNIENLNTSNVTDMSFMFFCCKNLSNLDVSNFDTKNVTEMAYMFTTCLSLTNLDLSNFNTSKVTDMNMMFYNCIRLNHLNVCNFDTSNVTNMDYMFIGCSNLTSLDVSNFETSNVTTMVGMFSGCRGLTTLDLSNYNTANVSDMSSMFNNSTSLITIFCGKEWNTKKVTSSTNMFNACTNLVGGAGTKYDANHVDVVYAHIDGGKSNPGYLTDKNAPQEPEKVCDSDDLLNALLALEGNGTGTEDNHATLTPCDSGLAVDNDVDIDDDLYIDLVGKKPDGSKSDMVFSGSSINVMTGSMVRMSQFVLKSEGNGGGISNSGNLTISDCELQDGDYTVENLSGSTMTLNDNTIAGSGIIVNSGNLYVDGSCTVNGLKNNAGGCIFLTSTPMTYIRIILDEVTVESLGVPVIAGADGYILTETDANALTIDVPDGYEWYYDADMQAVCIRTSTAIEDVRNNKTRVAEGYDTSGRKVSDKYRGLRILRMNDGSVKKNVKKN